jgi:hypothetical protein
MVRDNGNRPTTLAKAELARLQGKCSVLDKDAFQRHQRRIDGWDAEIRTIASTMGTPVPENCAAGVLPLYEINAVAQKVRSSQEEAFAIGINEGLFFFVEAMAEICALYFPLSADHSAALKKDPRGCQRFATLLHSLADFSDKASRGKLEMQTERVEFTEILSDLMPLYVATHEYAHVMHGHHAKLNQSGRRVPAGRHLELEEIPLSQRMEFEADLTGLIVALGVGDNRRDRLALVLLAADFYFAAIMFWEQFIPGVIRPIAEVLKGAAMRQDIDVIMPISLAPSETHPPTQIRRSMLRAAMICMAEGIPTDSLTIEEALRKKPPPNTELAIAYDMADQFDGFIAALWQGAKEDFSNLVSSSLSH